MASYTNSHGQQVNVSYSHTRLAQTTDGQPQQPSQKVNFLFAHQSSPDNPRPDTTTAAVAASAAVVAVAAAAAPVAVATAAPVSAAAVVLAVAAAPGQTARVF